MPKAKIDGVMLKLPKFRMPRVCGFFVALALLTTGFVPAKAQDSGPPERVPQWEDRRNSATSRPARVLLTYAGCLAKFRKPHALAFIAAVVDPAAEERVVPRLFQSNFCVHSGTLIMSAYRVRGALAEVLLKSSVEGIAPPFTPAETFETYSAKVIAADADRLEEEGEAILVAGWAAYCVAKERPDRIRALLRTRPHSQEELQVLNSLKPLLAQCLPDERVLDMDAAGMRHLLAQHLFFRRLNGER